MKSVLLKMKSIGITLLSSDSSFEMSFSGSPALLLPSAGSFPPLPVHLLTPYITHQCFENVEERIQLDDVQDYVALFHNFVIDRIIAVLFEKRENWPRHSCVSVCLICSCFYNHLYGQSHHHVWSWHFLFRSRPPRIYPCPHRILTC